MTDEHLVAAARGGDATAFAALLRRHQPRLLRACARMLGDPGAGADVAQDAALTAWLQLARLREPARFGAWLDGIGRMLCLRALRHRAGTCEEPTDALPELAAADADDPAERVLAAERRAELAAAIAALPDGQRAAVVLFHLADLPQETVAERLDTRAGAVRTRLHKARAALRARLGETPKEPPMPVTTLPARIVDVRRTPAGRHVVLLATDAGELPVWIGAPEAAALASCLQDVELPRPSAHALALSLVRACGREPQRVRISRLAEGTFYAELVLDDGTAVDARPSDALTLAVAAEVPIEIEHAVLDAAGQAPSGDYLDDLARSEHGGAEALAGEVRARLAETQAEMERMREAG